jgi:hypothetical protein
MSEKKNNASEKKGNSKNPNAKQQMAILRKSVKGLTARLVVLEEFVMNLELPSGKTVEQATITNQEHHNNEEITLRDGEGLDIDEFTKIQSIINCCTILPSDKRIPETMMHTKANISALCGFKVTDEMREKAYSDPKFMLHLEQFGLSRPEKEA